MDVRTLAAFVEVARRGGFSRAGETLHLTQPTVSKAVKSLEEELGQLLLAVGAIGGAEVECDQKRAVAAARTFEHQVSGVSRPLAATTAAALNAPPPKTPSLLTTANCQLSAES